jgi:hypothetical protein
VPRGIRRPGSAAHRPRRRDPQDRRVQLAVPHRLRLLCRRGGGTIAGGPSAGHATHTKPGRARFASKDVARATGPMVCRHGDFEALVGPLCAVCVPTPPNRANLDGSHRMRLRCKPFGISDGTTFRRSQPLWLESEHSASRPVGRRFDSRKNGISEHTWKGRYGGLDVSDRRRLEPRGRNHERPELGQVTYSAAYA